AAPFDISLAKKSIQINSANQIALTKLDIIFPQCKGIRDYSKLANEAKKFIETIESETGIPVTIIGTGSEIDDTIDRRSAIK
ncbi:MAG: adenylosuccinate synthetase, partial [Candidatus Nitrosocosmicus sp.]